MNTNEKIFSLIREVYSKTQKKIISKNVFHNNGQSLTKKYGVSNSNSISAFIRTGLLESYPNEVKSGKGKSISRTPIKWIGGEPKMEMVEKLKSYTNKSRQHNEPNNKEFLSYDVINDKHIECIRQLNCFLTYSTKKITEERKETIGKILKFLYSIAKDYFVHVNDISEKSFNDNLEEMTIKPIYEKVPHLRTILNKYNIIEIKDEKGKKCVKYTWIDYPDNDFIKAICLAVSEYSNKTVPENILKSFNDKNTISESEETQSNNFLGSKEINLNEKNDDNNDQLNEIKDMLNKHTEILNGIFDFLQSKIIVEK